MLSLRRRLPGEFVFALLLIVFSLFMLWQAYSISKFESLTSAGAFPMFAATVMLISGLIAAGETARMTPQPGADGESVWRQFVRQITPGMLVQFVVAIAAYMFLLERLGFVLSSYVFLVVSMWLLGSRKLILNLWVSALSLAVVYAIFQTIFAVVLPSGTWLAGVFK
ncbi:MAG: tripartite tricarboxylate transporter TctB family protein [Rhodoferax sp.]|uniref:tripartite tricarboxylate transporter TctB family protein n=1 Tax=Rhodoferax sp. TaxID=50421 RepID=UPI002619F2D6|nr:tripartite tricarboxylate transporter TctB family protein [Rhodoferax sp.]MDD2882444.1 tripartite tricarboxylate transporter TctB family protein [Rhodoferax sp.]